MMPSHSLLLSFYPFILAGLIFEIGWYLLIRKRAYPWREMAASLGVFALRIPARIVSALLIGSLSLFVWSLRPVTVPLDTVWGLALLFLAVELAYYWMHRADHMIRWMWASHVVHHTPECLHFASAFRLGATEFISGSWLIFLPLPLIGFNPAAIGAMLAINLFYQFWLHTDVIGRLGPIEWIFNTPSHHRVHHAANDEYLDRNFGGILIIWDRLFGTFAKEQPDIEIRYGLVQPIGSLHPLKIEFHEWFAIANEVAHANSFHDAMIRSFGRPGASFTEAETSPAKPTSRDDRLALTG